MACRFQQEGENEEARSSTDAKLLLSSLPTSAWLARVERLCAALGASMTRRLVMGAPQTLQEEANARWLLHPLLVHAEVDSGSGGVGRQEKKALPALNNTAGTVPPQSEEERTTLSGLDMPPRGWRERHGDAGASEGAYAFVRRLCLLPASRESRALSAVMKQVVLEDRGGGRDTNEAVWTVTVAVVHHAGVAGEAADVARAELARTSDRTDDEDKDGTAGVPVNLSPALVRAWRSAQTARVRLSSVALSSGTRALLLRRAYFLLFLKPWVSTSRGESSATIEGVHDAGVALALRTSELVLECLLGPAATTGARDRGDSSSDAGGVGVDGVGLDVGEREEDLGALLRIIEVQSERATSRARGLSLAVRLLDGTGSDRAAADVLRAVTSGLRAGRPSLKAKNFEGTSDAHGAVREKKDGGGEHDARRFHFMLGVECCDSASKAALVESTTGFLRQCSLVLGQGRAGDRGAAESDLARRSVLVHALVAVSMDYEWDDNDILQRSRLLPLISRLVDDADSCVAAAASTAVRAVYRCAVPEHSVTKGRTSSREQSASSGGGGTAGGGVAGEFGAGDDDTLRTKGPEERPKSKLASSSTPFQRAFFAAVRRKLQDMAAATGNRNLPNSSATPLLANEAPPAAGIEVEGTGGGSAGCTSSAGGEVAAGGGEATTAAGTALAAAQVLALAHACCRVECGLQELSGAGAVRALLRLVLLAESETRGWALRVCAATLPWVEPSLVDGEFR